MYTVTISQELEGMRQFGMIMEGTTDFSALFEVIRCKPFCHAELFDAVIDMCQVILANGEESLMPVSTRRGCIEVCYDPRHLFDG